MVRQVFNRTFIAVIVAVVTSAFVLPFIFTSSDLVFAGELEPREITISSSAPAATSVTYTAAFTLATPATAVEGVVIDFCANDPIPGDACNTGAGTNLNGFSLTSTPSVAKTGLSSSGSWTAATNGASPYHTLFYTDASATTTGQTAAVTVTISGVTNPTPNTYPGTFYARIFTYSSSTSATSYTSLTPGSNIIDQGGDALSIAQTISVTAKVFETLTFCVFTTTCGTAPTATLGAATTTALSTSNTYGSTNVAYTLATNAYNGVIVTMTGTTLCTASTLSYANCENATPAPTITALGATAAAPVLGNSQFGMCVTAITGVTAATTYTSSTNACPTLVQNTAYTPGSGLLTNTTYGFNDANSGTCGSSGVGGAGTNATCGSLVMSSTGSISSNSGSFTFIANIAATTPSGIYNANLNMVATAKF
jgi:hypothetical protein